MRRIVSRRRAAGNRRTESSHTASISRCRSSAVSSRNCAWRTNSSQTLANAARHRHWLGIGWTLEGHSSIERAAPGRGTPFFDDARDVFLLDGEELLACPSGTASPGCASGGTHATRVENYLRIARDASANQWTITGRDGTAHVYHPIATWLGSASGNAQLISNFRWLLVSVADTRGNRVDYDYRCEADAQCYPKSIRYNGTVVTFHLEARPTEDQNSYATGLSLAQAKSRIATVDITTGGERVRAYRLTYAQSPSTQLSRLVSVQQFGSDASSMPRRGRSPAAARCPRRSSPIPSRNETSGSSIRGCRTAARRTPKVRRRAQS